MTITVRFEGICTHITWPYPADEAWPHRVVLPKRWRPGDPEHRATLFIPQAGLPEQAVRDFASHGMAFEEPAFGHYRLRLRGVALRVENGTGPYLVDRTFLCGLPRLASFVKSWLGRPHRPVTNDHDPEEAWGYFNVNAGTWTAGLVHAGASAAVLDCETDGTPKLTATAFGRTDSGELTLPSSTTLTLQHVADDDTEDDFAIHYRVVRPDRRPSSNVGPTDPALCLAKLPVTVPLPPAQSIGPGCSNSLFP